MSSPHAHYQLVFEGLKEESPEVLRQVKVIFLGDLDLTVDQAQEILGNAPHVLRESGDRKALETVKRKLDAAGARVAVVVPSSGALPSSQEGYEFSFELGDLPITSSELSSSSSKEPRVYELPVEEGESDALSALNSDNGEGDPTSSGPATPTILDELNSSLIALQDTLPEEPSEHVTTLDTTSAENPATDETASLSFDLESSIPPPSTPSEDAQVPPPSVDLDFASPTSSPSVSTEHEPSAHGLPDEMPVSSGLDFGELGGSDPDTEPPVAAAPPKEEEWSEEDLVPRALLTPHQPSLVVPSTPSSLKLDPPPRETTTPSELAHREAGEEEGAEPAPQGSSPHATLAPVPESEPRSSHSTKEGHPPAHTPPDEKLAREPEDTPKADPTSPAHLHPSPSKTKKRKSFLPPWLPADIVAPISIGLAVLLVGNLWYATSSPKGVRPEDIIAALPDKGLRGVTATARISTKAAAPAVHTFAGVLHYGNVSIAAEILSDGERLFSRLLTGMTPAPPELTPEEIVQKKARAPWITKFEIQDVLFEPQSPGLFTGLGNTKLYVEYANEKRRIVGKAKLKAQLSPDNSMVTLSIESTERWNEGLPEGAKILPLPNREFSYALSLQVSVEQIEEAPAAGGEAPSSTRSAENESPSPTDKVSESPNGVVATTP